MLVCLKCFGTNTEYFSENGKWCKATQDCFNFVKKKNERGKHPRCVFEIDDDIADLIINLNKNGFETLYCCAGHFKQKENTILFKSGYFSLCLDGEQDPIIGLFEKIIPDKIVDYEFKYEITQGPKNILDHQLIWKLVIRWYYIGTEDLDINGLEKSKRSMLNNLYKLLNQEKDLK